MDKVTYAAIPQDERDKIAALNSELVEVVEDFWGEHGDKAEKAMIRKMLKQLSKGGESGMATKRAKSAKKAAKKSTKKATKRAR